MSAVSVLLGGAVYGIPVERVERILRPPAVSRVPFAPRDVLGIAQVGGVMMAVLDLGTRLRGAPAGEPGRLLVVSRGRGTEPVGLRVDAVGGLVDTEGHVAAPPDEAEAALPPGWLTGTVETADGRRVALLDVERVLEGGQA
ncbi:MAG TPA: chemotaxis protein CheW [Longimicrobiaceae bacterium]|nr:chemotaxis protein CheW [Longimicrobiaceae bacterium]